MSKHQAAGTDFARCVHRFLVSHLSGERNLSPLTIKSYGLTLKLFIGYLDKAAGIPPEQIRMDDLTHERVNGFLGMMEDTGGISPSTRNQRLAALKTFVRFAIREYPIFLHEGQRILATPSKKQAVCEIVYLEKEAMQALLSVPDQTKERERRDLAILALLYDTAARIQELLDLKVGDIRFGRPTTVTLTGKGNKARTVPIMDETADIIRSYFSDRSFLCGEALGELHVFNSVNRQQFTRPGIAKILKKYFSKAKKDNPSLVFPEEIHPHALRASKAIHLLEAKVNIIIIRDFLGHVDISTTQRYLRINNELKRDAITKAYPSLCVSAPEWNKNSDLMGFLKDLCS